MAKTVSVGGGVRFNPETGEFEGGNLPRPPAPPRREQPSRTSTYRQSDTLWGRFDYFISRIGNWFADQCNSGTFAGYLVMGMLVLLWIGFAIFVIDKWIDKGFFKALLWGVIGGLVFYYISMIIVGLFSWVVSIIMMAFRYLFYNAWSFLIPVVLVTGMSVYRRIDLPTGRETVISAPVVLKPNYICTASSLNVRSSANANSNANIIGKISRNQQVYVYSIENGFARIDFNGKTAYVSAEYLREIQ